METIALATAETAAKKKTETHASIEIASYATHNQND